NVLSPGLRVALFGKIELDRDSGHLQVMHPEFESLAGDEEEGEAGLHTGRIVPIYEAAGKITARVFRSLIRRVVDGLNMLQDPVPLHIRERLKLPDRTEALHTVHFPTEKEDLRLLNAFRSQAHFRLIFEEFFWLEAGLTLKRAKARAVQGIAFELNDRVREK